MKFTDAQLQYHAHFIQLLGGEITEVFVNRRTVSRGDMPSVYADFEDSGQLFVAKGQVVMRAADTYQLQSLDEVRLLVADMVLRVLSLRRSKAVDGFKDVTAEAWLFTAVVIPTALQLERLPIVDSRAFPEEIARPKDPLDQELIAFLQTLNDSLKD
jgi:hypothetical protein